MYKVYKHTTPSNKVYIGITKQTVEGRWKNGLGYQSSPHFWNAIQKYGWDNIKHEILHDGLTKEEACEYERYYINKYQSTDSSKGYNQTSGGDTGAVYNDEVRNKISDRQKEFYRLHPEKREELSRKVTGFKHSEEAKEKMRIAKTGTHFVMTDEWKARIGDANRKRYKSNPKLYASNAERMRRIGMENAKKIEQLDLDGNVIAVFSSLHEAERKTGIRNGNISRCCNGKALTTGGYRWRYAIEITAVEKQPYQIANCGDAV